MKMFLWSKLILSMCMFTVMQSPLQAQDLSSYKWKKRVVLVFTSLSSNLEYQLQIKTLDAAKPQLQERDVVVLVDTNAGEFTDLRKAFLPDDFLFVLIGKDGTVKYKSTKPVSVDQLTSLIDAMPMRRREIKQQN